MRPLVRLSGRLLLAFAPGMAAAAALVWGVESTSPGQLARALALLGAVLIALAGYLGMSKILRVGEVSDIVRTVLRRGTSGSGKGGEEDLGRSGDSTAIRTPTSPSIDNAPSEQIDENADQMTNVLGELDTSAALVPGSDPASNPARPRDALTPEPPDGRPSGPTMSVNAGTVLADRYRLEELLAEAPPTVTWRAFDLVLSRSVLLHLLPPHDPGAVDLLNVARQAAVATDSRFLRVLDAVYSDDDDIGCYIVCEYATGQSLELLLSHGPLSGLEAAWVVREVADALSGVHSLGLYHQRINPDTVDPDPGRARQDRRSADRGGAASAAGHGAAGPRSGRWSARSRGGRRRRSGAAAVRLPGVALARRTRVQPAGRTLGRSPLAQSPAGSSRRLPRPGQHL